MPDENNRATDKNNWFYRKTTSEDLGLNIYEK